MLMRLLTILLTSLFVCLQWPLWFGKGGWIRVWQLDNQLKAHRQENARLLERNNTLEAEVWDLKAGTEAIEERARSELGMIREGEIFFQVFEKQNPQKSASVANKAADGGKHP